MAIAVLGSAALLPTTSFAVNCAGLGTWSSSETYWGGHEVQHNDNAYKANWWTRNQSPQTHSGAHQEWTLLGTCDGGGSANQPPRANANGPYTGEVSESIAFSSTGSTDTDGTIAGYSWNFGDGNTSSNSNPSHSYATAGTYTVTLTVTDNDGATATASSATTITTGNPGNPGNPGSCSGIPTYVAGTPYATGQRVANVVDTSGDTVEFICKIAGWCSSAGAWAYEPGNGLYWESAWREVGRCDGGGGTNQAPIAAANGPYTGEAGATIAFSSDGSRDPDGTITAYRWSFGDGGTSDEANPGHSYAGNGTYTVTLSVTDNGGTTSTASTTATISNTGGSPVPNPQPKPGGGYTLTQANIDAVEAHLTDSPLFDQVKDSIVTRSNAVVEAVTPGRSANPANVRRVEGILNASAWDFAFPLRNDSYTYTRFLQAVAKFPAFCQTYTDGRNSTGICRKSLATMFAHFTQETGAHNPSSSYEQWRQGLFYLRELNCTEDGPGCGYNASCSPGTWQGRTWPCGRDASNNFKKYFGRGAKQLSYNYNYGPFSQAMFGDIRVLLDQPDRVASTWLNLASAVFFYVYPQPPKPSMLHVIDGTWQPNAHDLSLGLTSGFGVTTNIINGGIECGRGSEAAQSLNRIEYYLAHANNLNVTVPNSEQLGCAGMGRFDTAGAGALLINWEQDWGYYADRPGGKSFACKLVGYQTAYSALLPGDYRKCVEHYFDVTVVE